MSKKNNDNEAQVKQGLEDRGRAVGIEIDKRKSIEDITAEVVEAEAQDEAAKAAEAAEAAEAKAAEADAAEAAEVEQKSHIVTYDAITTMRGIMVKGDQCESRDFAGGDAQMVEMVKKGLVEKV